MTYGLENVPDLASDLLVVASLNDELVKRFTSLPGYRDLPSVREDAVVVLDQHHLTALDEPSPGSIEYILPEMDKALGRL